MLMNCVNTYLEKQKGNNTAHCSDCGMIEIDIYKPTRTSDCCHRYTFNGVC